MWIHLWTGGPIPLDYLEMLLLDRFGWTWDELRNTPNYIIERIIVMWSIETQVDATKSKQIAYNKDVAPTERREALERRRREMEQRNDGELQT